MCDYETPSVSSMRTVLTRKPHRCVQCRITYPAKTKMIRWGVCFDGTAMTRYVCETCEWMSRQKESSPFHICLDTAGSDDMNHLNPRWIEARIALLRGLEPDAEMFTYPAGTEDTNGF
jgi:hypothetical protein